MSQFGGVILDANSVLELTLESTANATMTVDGYISRNIHEGDAVTISRSERCARFLRGGPKSGSGRDFRIDWACAWGRCVAARSRGIDRLRR